MARKPPDLLVLGENAVTAALSAILKVPVVPRQSDDSGWEWPKGGIAEKCKMILFASPNSGADRIVRHHAEIWTAPGKSPRFGVVVLVPERSVAENLLARDVFGRRQATGSTFANYFDVVRVVQHPLTLSGVLSAVSEVKLLPVDTWHSQAKEASCIPLLLDAICRKSVLDLNRAIPLAKNTYWDSICRPIPAFPNHHTYAHAIGRWLDSVTPGVTPEWKTGFELIEPLANR